MPFGEGPAVGEAVVAVVGAFEDDVAHVIHFVGDAGELVVVPRGVFVFGVEAVGEIAE